MANCRRSFCAEAKPRREDVHDFQWKMLVHEKSVAGCAMQKLHGKQHGNLLCGHLLGVDNKFQVLAVRRVRDDVGDLGTSLEEVMSVTKVCCFDGVTVLLQHPDDGTITTGRFKDHASELLSFQQGLSGVGRCRVEIVWLPEFRGVLKDSLKTSLSVLPDRPLELENFSSCLKLSPYTADCRMADAKLLPDPAIGPIRRFSKLIGN
jgi:hypothetical protein